MLAMQNTVEGLSGLTLRVCDAKFSIRFNGSAYSIWIQIKGGEPVLYSSDTWFFNEQGMEEAGIWTMRLHAEIYKRRKAKGDNGVSHA